MSPSEAKAAKSEMPICDRWCVLYNLILLECCNFTLDSFVQCTETTGLSGKCVVKTNLAEMAMDETYNVHGQHVSFCHCHLRIACLCVPELQYADHAQSR